MQSQRAMWLRVAGEKVPEVLPKAAPGQSCLDPDRIEAVPQRPPETPGALIQLEDGMVGKTIAHLLGSRGSCPDNLVPRQTFPLVAMYFPQCRADDDVVASAAGHRAPGPFRTCPSSPAGSPADTVYTVRHLRPDVGP